MESTTTQDQNTEVTDNATQETTSQSSNAANLLSGQETRETSPFDAVFQEGALDSLPEDLKGLKNWVAAQKNGVGLENGLRHLQKLASSKGFERPAEDAPDDVREAFQAKLRELNGVPDAPDKYELTMPEGYDLPDEIKGKISEFAHGKGIPPAVVNDFLPFQIEMEKAVQQQTMQAHIESQSKLGDTYFGGEGSFNREAPKIAKWAEERGFDVKNDPAFRNATTYKLLADLKAATGEDTHVSGALTTISPANAQTRMQDILKSGDMGSTDVNVRVRAQEEYLKLAKMAFGKNVT